MSKNFGQFTPTNPEAGDFLVGYRPGSPNVETRYPAPWIVDLTLTANTTIANPSSIDDGQVIKWRIRQDVTGGWTVTLGSKFRIPASATTPLGWSTAPSKMDIFSAIYNETDDKWDVVSLIPGY